MPKPRVLIPVSLQFSVRYLLRTGLLNELCSVIQPVILLAWNSPELKAELEALGCEVHSLPAAKWGPSYERSRSFMNVQFKTRLKSPSTGIRKRRAALDQPFPHALRRQVRDGAMSLASRVPPFSRKMQERERDLFWSDTNARQVNDQLSCLQLDAAFSLTPFLYDEEMVLRALEFAGMPMATAILSFDNLTTRSWMSVTFREYFLWNRYNASELRRGYPDSIHSSVRLVGAPQFDHYYDRGNLWPESTWRQKLSLPADRPVILFGGGYFTCAPHEPRFLSILDEAISAGKIPERPVILFRKHPIDPIGRWEPVLRSGKNIVYDEPWQAGEIAGHTNVRSDDIGKLMATLHHSQVHVNVASTMAIDGAIVDRPQVGPAFDDSPGGRYHRAALECYLQEHFLPITHSGGVDIARDRESLIRAVREAIQNPSRLKPERERLVREVCTYHDGQSTKRVASAVRRFMGLPVEAESLAVGVS